MTKDWNDIWKNYKRGNPIGRLGKVNGFKTMANVFKELCMPPHAKILDVGCGSGETTYNMKQLGFSPIGIDSSMYAITMCEKEFGLIKGQEVTILDLLDAPKFFGRAFQMVFSGGLIEHYKEPDIVVKPLCELSNKWILIFQPNIWTPIDVLKRLYQKIGLASWEYEYRYSYDDYVKWFAKYDFKVKWHGTYNYTENIWILFERSW